MLLSNKAVYSSIIVFVVLILLLESNADSGELGVTGGAAIGFATSPYKDHDDELTVLPVINYGSNRLYVKGVSAGIHLFKNDIHTVSIGASYSSLHFDPKDTDSHPHKLLDKRKSTVMADLSYALRTPIGLASIKLSRDILGCSDGYTADIGFSVPIVREKFAVIPSAGVEWSSRKHSDYYYGISASESARSGLKQHSASGNLAPYISFDAEYKLSKRWSVVAGARVNVLTGKVKDSPMVDKSCTITGFLGATFSF